MQALQSLIPSVDEFLAMKPAELAPISLKLASMRLQPAGFWPESVTQPSLSPDASNQYPGHKKQVVDSLIAKTWNWIERQGCIEPSPVQVAGTG